MLTLVIYSQAFPAHRFKMSGSHQHGKNPFFQKNSELEEEMEAAVREGMEEHALPQMNGANPTGENNHSIDDGYSWVDRVANLEKQVFALSNEMASLKENYRNGHFVIVAKRDLEIFEENLAIYIYPRGRRFGKTEIFPNLMNWLNLRIGTPQGARSYNRWLQVQREV